MLKISFVCFGLFLGISNVLSSSVRRRSILEPPEGPFGCVEIEECDPDAEYRTADGSCNNLDDPMKGASHTPFQRYLPPQYVNDDQPRGTGDNNLPSPRRVSAAMSSVETLGGTMSRNTLLVMQWGQFLDHDLTFTPEREGFECCEDGTDPTQTDPDCLPIDVSFDAFYQGFDVQCLKFVRSRPADPSCGLEHREQVNALTSFIDGSNVYGSTQEEQHLLRAFHKGQLRISPIDEDSTGACEIVCPLTLLPVRESELGEEEFFGGDRRVEEQAGLTSMHTLLARAHNHIASEIYYYYYDYDDEKMFQEARRLVGAIIQQITYNEFLPSVLGFRTSAEYSLLSNPIGSPPITDFYDPVTFNPATPNVFAAAAFRFGHSLISNVFGLPDNRGLVLAQNFFNHSSTLIFGQSPSDILRGLSMDLAERMDHFMVETLTNKLFAIGPDFLRGEDLHSRNTMRARDHGIAPYTAWRELFNLPPIDNFRDLLKVMPLGPALALAFTYESVHDIDLFAAAISENPIDRRDGILGPTLANILGTRFREIKFSDRFFYESADGNPRPFTTDQLDIIKRTTLGSLICAYTDARFLQRYPMQIPSFTNPIEDCYDILEDSVVFNIHEFLN